MTGFLSDLVQYQGLFQMISVLGIGGTFQIGFQISSITYMSQHVKAFINETWLERYGYPLHQDNLLLLWSIIVSIFGIGGLLGSSGSRYLTAKYGKELLGSQALWPMLMASCGLPALVQLMTLPFFPESPPYLLMHKGDQEGCKKAIRQLWGEGHHQAEIDDIMREKATMKNIKILSVLELMKEPAFRWQLYMIVTLTATIQLCGITAVYFYTFEVLQAAGFDERMISYLTLSVGLSELVATVLCSSIIERLGRKVLLRGGYSIMCSLLAGITVTLSLQDWYFWMPYCSLCLIILFVVVFGAGPAGATVSIRSEIFQLSCRPPAFVIGAVVNWLGVFVIATTFPFIVVLTSKRQESALSPDMAAVFSDLVQFRGLFQLIFVLGIGGSFPYGFHISVISYPSVHIRKFINETWIERHGSPLHPETVMLLWSFIVSAYGIGGFLGSLCCGYLTTKYRKKKCQMCANLIILVAALTMAFSKTAKSFEMILVSRFLYGIGTDRFGRRVLLCGGYTLMGSVLALLTVTLSLQHQFFWMHYFSVILIFLFVIFYGTGPSGTTITIMVEIFSQSFRPSAFLIVGCINWMGLFVLGMIFPIIVENLGPFCFLIFSGILALSVIFIYLYLPETKGKSIMEIKAEFNKLNFGKKETSATGNNFPKEQLFCTKL
ncbi:solute carrier family 2, facilitated glucose transporter member 11 [Patagioenas fasciata monilis]|uniref:Solute carrier family 2, facilitated glucose transporter member 11 n=1 Tax=Patagioenas fasciata monilis TaxID=372326 RepID=A0A1V4JRM6_PATFA|nr:solute carrier family 2, facilitated glucose transporter member 11 [Patagioenas fasciata monilis]